MLFSPLLAIYYGYRFLQRKEDPFHWRERWGIYNLTLASDPDQPRFWVHAVSVGEVIAATSVLRELRKRHPEALIVLSVTTTGGREVAQSKVPPADAVLYFPLDFPFAVNRALKTIRPDALILMEWEIWPNLLTTARRSGATVAVVNGRISDKGLARGQKASALLKPGLDAVDLFAMQAEEDARRAPIVGADPARVIVSGNTKFDESSAMLSDAERADLRQRFGIPVGAPVWICGSTRDTPEPGQPDEEYYVAQAFETVRKSIPNLHLIIAPRHLERAEAAIKPFLERSLPVYRRTKSDDAPAPILLLDTFGELARAYAVADVAFIGGSLVRRGGQSVFQPLAQGVPAIFGPYMNNQRDIAALAHSEGVGFPVKDSEELASTVQHLLGLSALEKAMLSAKARALIERNQGVTVRAIDALEDIMVKRGTNNS